MNRPFTVVTHKRWLAEQFASMGAKQDFGFDIDPDTAMNTIWWAPGAWVASARRAGIRLPLMSCGPRWLSDCPKEFTGRWVDTMTVDECVNEEALKHVTGSHKVFIKLPEAKVDGFPARVHEFNRFWATTIGQYHLPGDTLVQMQSVVEFVAETRFWVAHGEIVAESPYRWMDLIWGAPEFDDAINYMAVFHWFKSIRSFASEVVSAVPGPPGYVLDIGISTDGKPLIVEANAAWSSGPYDGDPAGIFEAIKASHDFEGKHPKWAWSHNPVFDKVAPLKLAKPVERVN